MALYSSESSRGWVSFKDKEWLECEVVDYEPTHLNLKVKTAEGREETKKVARNECQFAYRNPSAVEGNSDFLTLPNLDEPNILHSLRVRYWEGQVYSYTGPILIAVNPWKRVDIYNAKVLEMHKAGESRDPHIFGVASKALRELINTRKNQCVLISGESGSGKTESTKYVLQILTSSGPGEQKNGSGSIENQVMMTNPVLEAFGNAKTVRNDNSSRFGKWISVHFDSKVAISGAEIKTYLLEKARVVQQSENERNYHIFYQICAAAGSHKILQDLHLAEASEFHYTKICLQARNTDDVKSFDETKEALRFIGFDNESQASIFGTLSAILHLGNMEISDDQDGNAKLLDDQHMKAICTLLQLDAEAFRKGICSRLIVAGTEKMVKQEGADKAKQGRDALAKALYSRLFDHVVQCVNRALRVKGTNKGPTLQASVLDIFGFEVFKVNRFEQFCINYANEKLQLHFNHYNFMLERQLYLREGIELVESDFVDNSASVELIENKTWGLQATLDDVCITPKGDDAMYLERLFQSKDLKTHKHFQAPKQRNGTFTVHHYADTVTYTVEEFCEKNKDLLVSDIVTMMQASKLKFVARLFETSPAEPAPQGKGGKRGGGGSANKSLSATFRADLGSLMEAINGADPHFVRAVNPNAQRKAELFEDFKVIEQLRCGGVIEAVRMCRESYPSRFPHEEFIASFSSICPEVSDQFSSKEEAKEVCLNMVKYLKVEEKQYRLGSSLILLKREAVDEMERKRGLLLVEYAITLQRTVRRYVSLLVFEKKQDLRRNFTSVLHLQSIFRRSIANQKYAKILEAVQQAKKRMSIQIGESNDRDACENVDVDTALSSLIAENCEKKNEASAVDSEGIPVETNINNEVSGDGEALDGSDTLQIEQPEDSCDDPGPPPWKPKPKEDTDIVQPLYVRIQVQANGRKEALLFNVERLVKGCRDSQLIKLHKGYLRSYPDTFSGPAMLNWFCGHTGNALFGDAIQTEENQKIVQYVSRNLFQKMLAMGVFIQVRGSSLKGFEDTSSLFRLYDDEKNQYSLNCRAIWFRSSRDPNYVVAELLYRMINLFLKYPNKSLKDTDDMQKFNKASAELQFVNINEMSRHKIIAFYLNTYNLMVLHAQAVLGCMDGSNFSSQQLSVKHEYYYRIAAYNYTLAEIEERLLNRLVRARYPPNSEKARAPEKRVHFALSMGCSSSPVVRIYSHEPEILEKELQQVQLFEFHTVAYSFQRFYCFGQAAVEYLTEHAKNFRPQTKRNPEITLPKIFEWSKLDFGANKQEIVSYYASFLPQEMRKEVLEAANVSTFVVKYNKFNWKIAHSKVCSSKYLKTEDDYIKDDFGEGNNDDEDGSSFLVTLARKTIRDNSNEEEDDDFFC